MDGNNPGSTKGRLISSEKVDGTSVENARGESLGPDH